MGNLVGYLQSFIFLLSIWHGSLCHLLEASLLLAPVSHILLVSFYLSGFSFLVSPVHSTYFIPLLNTGSSFLKKRFYLFIFRQREREEEREGEKHQCVVASHAPLLGTWPTTQACALIGNWTGNPVVCRMVLNSLSHTSQGNILEALKAQFHASHPLTPLCPLGSIMPVTYPDDSQIYISSPLSLVQDF